MERKETSDTQLSSLLSSILDILLQKGPSRTTMDYVASTLSISKRTLYEIFENKDEMLRAVLHYMHRENHQKIEEVFRTTPNIIEALITTINLHREWLVKTKPVFFRDMDEKYKNLRLTFDKTNESRNMHLGEVIEKGINQGLFRANCDYEINLRLLRVQIESIKRMEEYFPPEITIDAAFEAIARGFLRSISTVKGIEILDKLEEKQQITT